MKERVRIESTHTSYLAHETLQDYLKELTYCVNTINGRLAPIYPNYDGIDFCDVSAGGIQIRGHHKEIKGYTFGGQSTIKYDFSNLDEAIQEFIDMWQIADTSERVANMKEFIEWGEKYGWD